MVEVIHVTSPVLRARREQILRCLGITEADIVIRDAECRCCVPVRLESVGMSLSDWQYLGNIAHLLGEQP